MATFLISVVQCTPPGHEKLDILCTKICKFLNDNERKLFPALSLFFVEIASILETEGGSQKGQQPKTHTIVILLFNYTCSKLTFMVQA